MTDPLPLANLITLGARDFGTLRDFYRRLGWPQVTDDGEFAVFELRGIVLALFPLPNSRTTATPSPSHAPEAFASPSACRSRAPRRLTGSPITCVQPALE